MHLDSDGAFIDKIIKGAKAFRDSNLTGAMKKPPDINRWWDTLKTMINMRGTLQYYSGWYMRSMADVVKELHSSWLAHVFKHLFTPEAPVVFVLMILGTLSGRNLAVRKDGSGGFARALEKRFLNLGGQVTYGSTVEKIMIEKNRAVGVRLSNNEEYRADHIVSVAGSYRPWYPENTRPCSCAGRTARRSTHPLKMHDVDLTFMRVIQSACYMKPDEKLFHLNHHKDPYPDNIFPHIQGKCRG